MGHPFDPLLDPNCYFTAWRSVLAASGWKTSVKRFGLSLASNINALIGEVAAGTYQPDPPTWFTVRERGHERLVRALGVRDRLLQAVLCDFVLIPRLRPCLIHDNGASLRGKGISFTRARLERHLREHMRAHGTSGWILKVDYRKFFDSIPHDLLLNAIMEKIPDPRLGELLAILLRQNEVDISCVPPSVPDSEVFASTVWRHGIPMGGQGGVRILRKGLGIGAPLSQIAGIFYPTPIDNWCKSVQAVRLYGRYMDDTYIIDPSKDRLLELRDGISIQARRLGLAIHPQKTSVNRLGRGFTFLKVRYRLTETGGIVRRIDRDTIARERRRIRLLARLVAEGVIPPSLPSEQWRSWIGDKKGYAARRALNELTHFYQREMKNALRVAEEK